LHDGKPVNPALRPAGIEDLGVRWREIENRLTGIIEEIKVTIASEFPRRDGSKVRERLQAAERDCDLLTC